MLKLEISIRSRNDSAAKAVPRYEWLMTELTAAEFGLIRPDSAVLRRKSVLVSVGSDRTDAVFRILFVCTGNTCRSPMAEAIFRKLLTEKLGCREWELREKGIDVFSAGVSAIENYPATREAIEALGEYNLDLSQHLSQRVTARMLVESTRVLAMTSRHLQVLQEARPDLSDRFHLLDRSGRDISDPIGSGFEAYQECAREIRDSLAVWVDELFEKESGTQ